MNNWRLSLWAGVLLWMVLGGNASAETAERELRVLQFNIWQEGTVVEGGFEAIVDEIVRLDVDLVALSEVRNYWFQRFDRRLVRALAKRGYRYYGEASEDSGLISRYPILEQEMLYPVQDDRGSITRAVIDLGTAEVAFYSAHLDYRNCSYYLPRGYHSSTWQPLPEPVTDIQTIARDNAASMRDEAIDAFLLDAREQLIAGRLVILAGDFNEPSHRDWTEATAQLYDHHGVVIPWRNTLALEQAGFVDSYRARYPNPGLEPLDSVIVGPRGSIVRNERVPEATEDPFVEPAGVWPTDHKALLSTFALRPDTQGFVR